MLQPAVGCERRLSRSPIPSGRTCAGLPSLCTGSFILSERYPIMRAYRETNQGGNMAKPFVERARRFPVSRKSELRLDEHRFKGLIQNISEKGVFVVSNYDLEVGMEIWIKVELAPGLPFEGKLRVRHFDEGRFGAEIIEADPQSRSNWKQFLETNYPRQSE
jgi:PilZ domain-containing protein